MSGTQAMSAVSVAFISLESHEAVKARMEVPFCVPRGYNPVCCVSRWPPTPRHASPALGEDGQAALPELLPWGLDCRWSVEPSCLLPLSAPSLRGESQALSCKKIQGRGSFLPQLGSARRTQPAIWLLHQVALKQIRQESLKSGSDPGSLVWRGRSYWPSISDFSFLWPQEYHKSLLRVKNQPIREVAFIQRPKLL